MDNANIQNGINYGYTPQGIPNYVSTPLFYTVESQELLDFREKMARKLGPASLIYAVFSTFCLYKNLSGVTMPFFGIATLAFMIYGLKLYNVEIKRASWFYGSTLLALSISNFLTGNHTILFFNNVGIFFMLFVFLLHNVYDDSRWNFSKTTKAVFEAFFGSFGVLDDYLKDMKVLKIRRSSTPEKTTRKTTIKYILIGLLISIPLVSFLIVLLSGADAVFGNIFESLMLNCIVDFFLNFGNAIGVTITFIFIFFAAYCIMRFFSKKTINEEVVEKRNYEPIIAITVLSIISVVYLIFSVIQIVYLFIGGGELPTGYTYAEYAREGFFELLTVAIINFLMVLFVNNRFRESRALKILMTVISGCTYIMIASSCMRMLLYIDAYLLTSLRILVLWGLAVLALLFAAVIASIFKHDFPLFRYSIIVVSVMYMILSFSHYDYIIADYNLSHIDYAETEEGSPRSFTDYDYLATLSTDAAPVIAEYKDDWADGYFQRNRYHYEGRSWRQLNLSLYTAKELADYR